MGDHAYLIRYGLMAHVSRFRASPECEGALSRGQAVVLQTDRGVELGEVLVLLEGTASAPDADRQRVLRPAAAEDLCRARNAEAIRSERFALCQRVLREGEWPWVLLDVEPMLDDHVTVLHYLGPHQIDAATLRARFRMTCEFDVVLEPAGSDLDFEDGDAHSHPDHGGGCGSCGSGGGCGSCGSVGTVSDRSGSDSPGRPAPAHSGCDSCGIGRLIAARGHRKVAGQS